MFTIRELRERNYLTQRELAEKLNVHYMTVHSWESFKSAPRMRNIVMIADFFGVDPDMIAVNYKDAVDETVDRIRKES